MQGINVGKPHEIKSVPIDYFLGYISKATGWDKRDFLQSKDIGTLEKKLNVRAEMPIQSLSTKRGKSKNVLYLFVNDQEKEDSKKSIEKLICLPSDK